MTDQPDETREECLTARKGAATAQALVQAPINLRPDAPSALLLLMPGALLHPKDYSALLEALQAEDAGVNLWVAVADIDWVDAFSSMQKFAEQLQLGNSPLKFSISAQQLWADEYEKVWDTLGMEAISAACAAGFPLHGKLEGPGRLENVFVALHSVSVCFYGGLPLRRCAATVLMGAVLDDSVCKAADILTAPKPLMHILGQLDGQMPPRNAAHVAAAYANSSLAAQAGARRSAQTRPFAVIPGCNHAQFSNGVVVTERGDLPSDVPLEEQAGKIAQLITTFVVANHLDTPPAAAQQAIGRLLQAATASCQLLGPFAAVAEAGSLDALIGHAAPGRSAGFGRQHGEAAVAEEFGVAAQRRMLAASLPGGWEDKLRVVATVHTQVDSFTYSQPIVYQAQGDDGEAWWVLQCHVLISKQPYEPGPAVPRWPTSPHYALKLKKGAAVARAMGIDGASEAVISAAEMNQETMAQVLEAAPKLFLNTYRNRGMQLRFAPDRDLTGVMRTPVDWIKKPLSIEPVAGDDRAGEMTATYVSTPVGELRDYEHGPGRFAGNHYIKCCSPAWLHEWVMVQSLRH